MKTGETFEHKTTYAFKVSSIHFEQSKKPRFGVFHSQPIQATQYQYSYTPERADTANPTVWSNPETPLTVT